MIVLAADTSTAYGSVALRTADGTLLTEDLERAKPHSETLLPAMEKLLVRAGVSKKQVEAVAVGTGPGAFTGLRVGLATFQAWAAASRLPLIPVVSLDAVAWPWLIRGTPALVLSDARKGEVYAACYPFVGKGGLPQKKDEVILIPFADVPKWVSDQGEGDACLTGTALRILDEAGVDLPDMKRDEGDGAPGAGNILVLAEKLLIMGLTVRPSELLPTYVRPPDARKPSPGSMVTGLAERDGEEGA